MAARQYPDESIKTSLPRAKYAARGIDKGQNQLHAWNHSYKPAPKAIRRFEARLALIKAQILDIEQGLQEITKEDKELDLRVSNVCTIKGIGFISAIAL